MATPREHIEEIRKTKFSIGGEPNPLTEDLHQAVMNLSGELYAKDVHFLMELIQNAEDNEYLEGVDPSLEFVVTSRDITATGAPATLLIFNNERGFTPRNIDSICSVGRSTKKGNRRRGYIGEKGIGFKSVFLITAQPYIFSNGYQIRFTEGPCPHCNVGYIVPEWVETNPTLSVIESIYGTGTTLPTTTIILPLKRDKVKPVKHQLSNIHPEILLFLTKIKRLSVREDNEDPKLNTVSAISISSETNFVTRKNIDAESYVLHLSADDMGDDDLEKECGYHMWRQRFPVKKDHKVERRMEVEEWVITLAFPSGKRLLRGMQSPGIYAFLPTEMVTNFPFIIQADFILASSRENILLDNKWNKGILDCVSSAFISAFTSLVKDTEAPISTLPHIFGFLPVNKAPYMELNAVRESIKQKLLNQCIVPCESYSEQKFFHKPCEVGGILPAFWNILDQARAQGVALDNISSHGTYILSSSFDAKKYDQILEFMGVKFVADEWYVKCIQSSDIILGVSEDVYLELLLFVAENWKSSFHTTNMKNASILKYVDIHGNVSLTSVNIVSRCDAGKLFMPISTEESSASWLINWSREFRCATDHLFMPISTQQAIGLLSKKWILLEWLLVQANVKAVSVYDYALVLNKAVKNDRELAIAYCHFLYHSFSKKHVSKKNVKEICSSMPLIDSYGQMMEQREKVLRPANGSNWVELIGTNPWRTEGYVELGKDYLQPASYVGIHTAAGELISFLKCRVPALDIPYLSPPNAVIPTMSAPLTRNNVFLLLDWIRYLRRKDTDIPQKFLSCIKEGSWLKISLNGSSSYRPPSQSFMFSTSGANILQQESELVDIPVVDMQFYGHEINDYKEELRVVGVMFEVNEACRFIGNQLMSIAASSNLTRDNVLSILKFIKFLKVKLLPAAEFVNSIKSGRWLRTNLGDRSPGESVLNSEEWKAASEVSNIPLIDETYYGANLRSYKDELELIGVKVNFNRNYQLVGDNLKSSACLCSLSAEALYLMLNCLRHSRILPHSRILRHSRIFNKIVHALKDIKCIRTIVGFKTPSECYLPDSEWGCLLQVFSCFPILDEKFYGSKILLSKDELKQIGVVVDSDEASKRFEGVFKQQASLHSIGKDNVLKLLECYKKLKKSNSLPTNVKKCICEVKWLRTRLGDYRVPADCVLFGQCWQSISSISLIPFVDDGDNQYGTIIHEYEEELKSMGVVSSFKDGARFVVNGLYLPQDPSRITPENVYSLLECIRSYKPEKQKLETDDHFPSTFREKIGRQWLKTYTGYRTPQKCMLFSPEWASFLERSDGPFLDENYYGSKITEYTNELRSLGVIVDTRNGCSLLANYLDFHSRFTTVVRIYKYLLNFNWKPDDEGNKKIWIPSGTENGQWVSSEDCVIHDKNGLLGSRLHVLEQHYDDKLLFFFSINYGVKMSPSVDDYCEIWKSWEASGHQVTHDESCAFWEFVVKNWSSRTEETLAQQLLKVPVYSGSSTINLVNKHDVFIADDLQLKDLFEKSSFGSLFVWYPQPSMKSLPRTKLLEIYSKIGVRSISKSVKQELSVVNTVNLKQLNPKETFIGKGLFRLILGFLIEVSPKTEADSRYDVVRRLLDVTVFEAGEPITMSYALSLSSGKILNVEARQMLRWERQNSKLFVQKLDKDGGHKNVIEYASHFSEVVAGGLLWENEDHMLRLAELISLGFFVEFNEDAVKYLMKKKNLQIFLEDEEFLSSSFPDN